MTNAKSHNPIALRATLMILSVSAGCFPGAPYDCRAMCNENRRLLVDYAYQPDGEPLDEATVCDNAAVADATDACSCRTAFENEYRLQFTALTCDCPEEGDTIPQYQEDCSLEQVPADAQNCFSESTPMRLFPTPPSQCVGN